MKAQLIVVEAIAAQEAAEPVSDAAKDEISAQATIGAVIAEEDQDCCCGGSSGERGRDDDCQGYSGCIESEW